MSKFHNVSKNQISKRLKISKCLKIANCFNMFQNVKILKRFRMFNYQMSKFHNVPKRQNSKMSQNVKIT